MAREGVHEPGCAPRRCEAAHLERGGHVHGPVQRAADDGRQQRDAATGAAGRARRAGPLRLAEALGVGGEHGQHARGEGCRESRAEGQPAEHAQELIGVDGEPGERGDEDEEGHLERDHGSVQERLEREIALAERSQVAEPGEHGEALAADEHVDHHDGHGHDQSGAQ